MRWSRALVVAFAILTACAHAHAGQEPTVLYLRDVVPVSWRGNTIDEHQWKMWRGTPPGILKGREYGRALMFELWADTEVVFYLRGTWDWFETVVGIDDRESREDAAVQFEVFGDNRSLVATRPLRVGSEPVSLRVPVKGVLRLKLAMSETPGRPTAVWGDARLVRGQAPPPPETSCPPEAVPQTAAPFAVDPKDLKTLAEGLRREVDSSPALRERIARSQVAIATFSLIDIPSPSVAHNVAEDLYTQMIKADFGLVERGQLDKVLKELGIQNMGLVDPKTAERIGQLAGCDVILLGSISDRGQFVVINARLMETATGKSLVAEQVEMRKMPIIRTQ